MFSLLNQFKKILKSRSSYHLSFIEYENKSTIKIDFETSQNSNGYYLFLDTETTGLPLNPYETAEKISNWPNIVSISWLVFDIEEKIIEEKYYIIKQKEKIPEDSIQIHGITDEISQVKGEDIDVVLSNLSNAAKNSKIIIAHNIDFDLPVIESEFLRNNFSKQFEGHEKICTMKGSKDFVGIYAYNRENDYSYTKFPKLKELFRKCFPDALTKIIDENFHNSNTDVKVTAICFLKLKEQGVIKI